MNNILIVRSCLVGFDLFEKTYVTVSGDVENKTYFGEQMELLKKDLRSIEIQAQQGILSS